MEIAEALKKYFAEVDASRQPAILAEADESIEEVI